MLDDLKQMLDESWREERNIFEPIFSATICGSSGFGPTLTLSDTGSTVAFVDCKHMDNLEVTPAGSWKGVIETLYSQNEVKTPFYKLTLKLPDKSNFNLFALGGSNIGSRKDREVSSYMPISPRICLSTQVWRQNS